MHILSAGMHNANPDSSAGFSKLHLVSLGTTYRNALRFPKRITKRNVSAVCFSVQKGGGTALLKMSLEKPLEKILSFGEMLCYSKQSERRK